MQAYLDTLEEVKSLSGAFFVPAHAEACEDVSELAQYNIDTVNEIAGRIKSICTQPVNFEALLQRLFDEYALELSFEQYTISKQCPGRGMISKPSGSSADASSSASDSCAIKNLCRSAFGGKPP